VEEAAIVFSVQPESSEAIPVCIVDASQNGIGIRMPLELLPGTLIRIRIGPSAVLIGEVRHTVPCGMEFQAGVHIEHVKDCRGIRSSLAKMWNRDSYRGTGLQTLNFKLETWEGTDKL
jgi:hypothetical protein